MTPAARARLPACLRPCISFLYVSASLLRARLPACLPPCISFLYGSAALLLRLRLGTPLAFGRL